MRDRAWWMGLLAALLGSVAVTAIVVGWAVRTVVDAAGMCADQIGGP